MNYRNATLEETVEKVLESTYAAVHEAKKYYAKKGDQDVVDKIKKACKLAAIERIKRKLEETNDETNCGVASKGEGTDV